MATVTATDAFESWHQRERNPILATHGTLQARGLTLELAPMAALIFVEIRYRHNANARKVFWVMNSGITASRAVVAWRDRR